MSESIKLKTLTISLERLDKLINFATVKASIMLPANAVLITYLLKEHVTFLCLLNKTHIPALLFYSFILALLASSLSVIFAVFVIKACLKSGHIHGKYYSLLFFQSIATMEADTYITNIDELTEKDLIQDLARQIHIISEILTSKYRFINWSVWSFLLAFICLTGTILLTTLL
jgi:hypothetical protein